MMFWIVCTALLFILGLFFKYPYFLQDLQNALFRHKLRQTVLGYMQTNYLILDRFLELVKAQPHKPLVLFQEETFTYQDADVQSNKAARALLQSGVQQGDTVALFLGNEPMFLWLWLALVKIGCSAAFLNSNIRSKSLLHCFKCSGAKTLVAGGELQQAVEEALPSLQELQVTVLILADGCKAAGVTNLREKIQQASSEALSKELRSQVTLQSPAVYIYTSGTTGLPKAALITHGKLWNHAHNLASSGVNNKDVVYCCLPVYHSSGFVGFTGTIQKGMTYVLRSKFSSSQFWDDCRKYNVTVIQYIGEIMRYLCNTPQKASDHHHKVRVAVGNGIRPDVWREFIRRFGDIKIREFYGATEGNFVLMNYSGKIGAVGRDSFLYRRFFHYTLIKYDVDSGEPERDSSGLCIKVPKGEAGLLVTEISPKTPFLGYTGDLQQTERKKLHDVLKKGDLYFNTGDVLRIDEDDFFYFQDRVGDTFRWKGENVATNEVADVVTLAGCIQEANVYGVEVPGHEGRVGMAAVTLRDGQEFDSAAVFKQVADYLPSYARPRFIRIQSSLEVTGTFKLLKGKLVKEGFNFNEITDPLYILDEKVKNYIPLTADMYNSILAGSVRL